MQPRTQNQHTPRYPSCHSPRSGIAARVVVGALIALSMASMIAMLAIAIG